MNPLIENNGRSGRQKTRAVVIRCDDEAFLEVLERLRAMGCYVVFSKSSEQKLVIKEEAW